MLKFEIHNVKKWREQHRRMNVATEGKNQLKHFSKDLPGLWVPSGVYSCGDTATLNSCLPNPYFSQEFLLTTKNYTFTYFHLKEFYIYPTLLNYS